MVWMRTVVLFSVAAGLLMKTTTAVRKTHYGSRVLHGKLTYRFAHPYIVYISVQRSVGYASCTGFILSPKLVMTANHCFTSKDENGGIKYHDWSTTVYAGTQETYNDPLTWQERRIRKVVRSPDYVPHDKTGAKGFTKDDVAIIILDESLDYNEEVNHTVMLDDDQEQINKMNEGAECLLLGFGISATAAKSSDWRLRGETTYLLSDAECKTKHCEIAGHIKGLGKKLCERNYWEEGEICTFSEDTTTCSGDSGGPLMCDGKVYAVVSYGLSGKNDTCIDNAPDVHANVRTMVKVWGLLTSNEYSVELSRSPKYRQYPNAPERAHPFVVKVSVSDKPAPCTGTIIQPNLILTACHCIMKGDGTIVEASQVEITAGAEPHYVQTSKAQVIIPHKECAKRVIKTGKKAKTIYSNDVAFLILESKLQTGESVKSIDVGNPKNEKEYVLAERECHVYGFGRQRPSMYKEPASTSITMNAVFLSPEVPCRKRFCNATSPNDELCSTKHYYSKGWLCGKRDDFAHCFGHTGGPVVCSGLVYGIDSIQLPCRSAKCEFEGECYDEPALFQNTIAIWQVYVTIKMNPTYKALVFGT